MNAVDRSGRARLRRRSAGQARRGRPRARRRRRSDPLRRARAGGRGRHRRAVDGPARPTGRRRQGDDLPTVGVEGVADPRCPAHRDVADPDARRRRSPRRPDRLHRCHRRALRRRQHLGRAPAPDRRQLLRRTAARVARGLHAELVRRRCGGSSRAGSNAASSRPTRTSTCSSTSRSDRSSTVGCSAAPRSTAASAAVSSTPC